MPEPSDDQLKDRVQKLERLLRVSCEHSFCLCDGRSVLDSTTRSELTDCLRLFLQTREERIVALETENAMLYLKLAQVC